MPDPQELSISLKAVVSQTPIANVLARAFPSIAVDRICSRAIGGFLRLMRSYADTCHEIGRSRVSCLCG